MASPKRRVVIEHLDVMIRKEITMVDEIDQAIIKAEKQGQEALAYSLALHEGRLTAFRYMRSFITGEIVE